MSSFVRRWTLGVGCSLFILLSQSSVLSPPSCRAQDTKDENPPVSIQVETNQPPQGDSLDHLKSFFHRFESPKQEPEIPIKSPRPRNEDSLDHLKKLLPRFGSGGSAEKPETSISTNEPQPMIGRAMYQLKDYNWEQNINLHIGAFTILGYRDAGNHDTMLFRFLTPEEHAQKRVMNSKASLLYTPRKKKVLECGGLTPPSPARLDAPP